MMAGVILREVSAGYGSREVLRSVTMEASPGQVTGLIGPNGSGKTTLVRVASRGLRPTSGTVRVDGVDPYSLSPRRAARLVAVVPQDLLPAFPYSVMEVVMMGRAPYLPPWGGGGASEWARVREAMAAASVQHLADRPVGELSGGERQGVILAQALAQDAPVLLLDEPTTHLDLRHVLDMLSLIRRLAREGGRTVVAVFHDLNLASAYCDHIVAVDSGRVVAAGPPAQVITPSMVREVFGIEAEVLPTAAAGRPLLLLPTAQISRPGAGAPRAHVIPGAGRGSALMRSLVEGGFDVTVGVLHEGDTDASVAERLNLARVVVPPFASIDATSARDCLALIDQAQFLLVCDAPFGSGNVENLRLALAAAGEGKPTILVDDVPMGERDFTGGEASRLWAELSVHATVVRSFQDALAAAGAVWS